jgi:uncharacterized protein YcgL (UPF0745 family)
MTQANTPCWIYKSPRKEEMYLYLARKDGFDAVPDALLTQFGIPVLVMEIELNEGRNLAREDVNQVRANLRARGFHLQMPPVLKPDLYHRDEP